MVIFLISLVGVPPLAGFFGKFLLFGAAIDAGFVWLVAVRHPQQRALPGRVPTYRGPDVRDAEGGTRALPPRRGGLGRRLRRHHRHRRGSAGAAGVAWEGGASP
ncbi:MAG: hypothetical protein M3P49_00825 [Actinomycetota bacterium]|nr:hypothetical protein [Actinomycetota bacterium]